MCENRERLIGYVYDECDPAERQAIEAHLSSCPTCRHEIRGLRGVRQDLLAWDVPGSEPIWRPMAPPRQQSPWQAMPAWAMAAAAGLILAVGAAGGAAVQAVLPAQPQSQALAEPTRTVPATPSGISPAELSAFEERMLARMRAELEDRVRVVSAGTTTARSPEVSPETRDLARRVNLLTTRQDEMSRLLFDVATQADGIRRQQTGLEHRSNLLLASLMQEQGATQGFQGGR